MITNILVYIASFFGDNNSKKKQKEIERFKTKGSHNRVKSKTKHKRSKKRGW